MSRVGWVPTHQPHWPTGTNGGLAPTLLLAGQVVFMSERAAMGMTEIIYVKLLEEGTDVWRPTMGEKVEGLCFVLRPTSNYDPRDETWEFLPGETVA